MNRIHIVATTYYGAVTLTADRVYHTEQGALLFFSWVTRGVDENQSAAFAPGTWRMHFNPENESIGRLLLENISIGRAKTDTELSIESVERQRENLGARDANRVDDPG